MKKLFLLSLGALFFYSPIFCQTYEDYVKKQQEQFNKLKKEQEQGIKKIKQDYNNFVKAQDEQFADFLKRNWKAFEIMTGKIPAPDKPKPRTAPVMQKEQANEALKLNGQVQNTVSDRFVLAPMPRFRRTPIPDYSRKKIEFDFYGTSVTLQTDQNLCKTFSAEFQEEDIANYWLSMSNANYDDLLDLLFGLKTKMGLNDWGYYMLLYKFASSCVADENSRQLFTWFFLTKSGYIANIGYGEGQVTLLLPTLQEIYFYPYITKDNIRYYLTRKVEHVKTYEGQFPGSNRYLDLRFETALNFPETYAKKKEIEFRGHTLSFAYNSMVTQFYNDYPSTTLDIYFNAPVSGTLKESLAETLRPLLENLQPEEQVGTLLSLLHESFPYQTDEEQFGREKYFFAEEILAYPYSDCEDRAVFFSYLVKTLVGVPDIGLSYPGHVATAVQLESSEGDYLTYNSQRYWICDPTYIGASVGMAMPDMSRQTAEIIPISDYSISRNREEQILRLISRAGGTVLNPFDNIVYDEHQNVYVTGIFEDQFAAGQNILTSPHKSRSIFVSKIDTSNTLQWSLALGGEGCDMPQQLKLHNGTLLLSGIFEKTAYFGKDTLKAASQKDLFVSAITPEGKIRWTGQGNLKEDSVNYNYILKFNQKGEVMNRKLQPDWPSLLTSGITITPRQEIILAGAFNQWGNVTTAFAKAKASITDITEELKELTDNKLKEKTEKGIAGLLAVVELVNNNQMAVSGEIAVKALDKYNPTFKTRCPTIYKNICQITFLRNEEGIITLKTQNGKPVNFDKVRVKDGSKMKIVYMPNGDVRVDVINNIVVGKAFIWFPLNRVTLYRESGDMLFDYDKDHTLRTFNLTKDILN